MIMPFLQIITTFIHPINKPHQIPPLNLPLQTLGELYFLVAPIPLRKMDRTEHDSRVVSLVGHSCVPEVEIADYERAFSELGLDWIAAIARRKYMGFLSLNTGYYSVPGRIFTTVSTNLLYAQLAMELVALYRQIPLRLHKHLFAMKDLISSPPPSYSGGTSSFLP